MTMTTLEKELVALAISVAAGCRPCVTHHLVEVRKAGGDDDSIVKAVGGAVCVRNSAGDGMRRHALGLDPAKKECGCTASDPLTELIALGAALAVNCTAETDKHLTAARSLGVAQDQLDEVFALAAMIRTKAIGHAEARLGGAGQGNWGEPPKAARCC
ncbi:carboxymuconolactone decarboxylase family protein [Paramagnetospirillum magnetotacticum]|nr:carboxymuconolactone decarboxylase family protein [Paramagnetospirillum magnetotacticum]